MNLPATAGRVLSESELRAFLKCSQFFFYGGIVEESTLQSLVRKTVEYILAYSLKENTEHSSISFQKALRRIVTKERIEDDMNPIEFQQLLRKATYSLNTIWSSLDSKDLVTLSSALDHRMVISQTPIDLHISGVLRRISNKELVFPIFSPYSSYHSQEIDPIVHMQLSIIKQFGTKHWARPTVTAKIIHVSEETDTTVISVSDTSYNNTHLKQIESIMKTIEIGHHYPIAPCPYRCPYKLKCFPGKIL